jgi:hypothetical protein
MTTMRYSHLCDYLECVIALSLPVEAVYVVVPRIAVDLLAKICFHLLMVGSASTNHNI